MLPDIRSGAVQFMMYNQRYHSFKTTYHLTQPGVDILPYVASSSNLLKEGRFSTRVFQTDIHLKNGKLQRILQIRNKTVNII